MPVPVAANLTTVLPSLRVLRSGNSSFAGALVVRPAAIASKQQTLRATREVRLLAALPKRALSKQARVVVRSVSFDGMFGWWFILLMEKYIFGYPRALPKNYLTLVNSATSRMGSPGLNEISTVRAP